MQDRFQFDHMVNSGPGRFIADFLHFNSALARDNALCQRPEEGPFCARPLKTGIGRGSNRWHIWC